MPEEEPVNYTSDWTMSGIANVVDHAFNPESRVAVRAGLVVTDHRGVPSVNSLLGVLERNRVLPPINGSKFLEIGAGQSNMSARLRVLGGTCYAVDPAYADMETLNQRNEVWLAANVDASLRPDFVAARSEFRKDFETNREYYKAAWSTHLPFPNNEFDLVISMFCISPVVSPYREELLQSLEEVIRVLKPGRQARIYPFDHVEDLYFGRIEEGRKHRDNIRSAMRFLKVNPKIQFSVKHILTGDTRPHLIQRELLVIEKTTAS